MALDGIRMNTVVNFGKFPFGSPPQLFLFFLFQPLELVNQVEFESHTNSCSKLKSNILESVCAAITTFLHNDANGICLLNPFTHAHDETWQTCLHSKVVKFDHFKIGIVYHLPSSQKLYSIASAYPVLDDVGSTAFTLFAISHICK